MIETLHFVLPKERLRDFTDNPFDYLLRANGMKSKRSAVTNVVLNLQNDADDDSPILPILDDVDENEDDDDELLPASPVALEVKREERSESFLADQEAIQNADADIPDADQLGNEISTHSTRNSLDLLF